MAAAAGADYRADLHISSIASWFKWNGSNTARHRLPVPQPDGGLTYVYSDYVPYQQHVLTSFFRLAGQVTPLIVIWLVYGIVLARNRGITGGRGV